MLQLITGGARTGKSYRMYAEIAETVRKGEKDVFLIVPEQFTFETEKTILKMLSNSLAARVNVMSFKSLAAFVRRQMGSRGGRYIDGGARLLIMELAVESVSDMLNIYSRPAKRPAFLKKLINAVDELKRGGVSELMLEKATKMMESGSVRDKLSELALIYASYNALLAESFADGADELLQLAEALCQARLFENAHIYFHGFTGFTAVELKVIEQLMVDCEKMTVTLTMKEGAQSRIFSECEITCARLKKMAESNGVKQLPQIHLDTVYGMESEGMRFLEKNIFACGKETSQGDGIHIYTASSPYNECEYAAMNILRLCREEKCKFSDAVLIARSPNEYAAIAQEVFARHGIPVFTDMRTAVLSKPIMLLVFSALDIVSGGWETEDIFRYLKCGLVDEVSDDVDLLEMYATTWRIKGKRWTSEEDWVLSPNGYRRFDDDEQTAQKLKRINDVRRRVVKPLMLLEKAVSGEMTATNISKAITGFLAEIGAPQRIKMICDGFTRQGELALAEEYRQLWETFTAALSQTVYILKDAPMTVQSYKELLKLVISEYDIGRIPLLSDAVFLAAADRSRLHEAKYVFLLGFNDGSFPKAPSTDNILGDDEKKVLEECGITISKNSVRMLTDEEYYVYMCLTAPSKELFICDSAAGMDGKPCRPSYVLAQIKEMFPKLKKDSFKTSDAAYAESVASAFDALGKETDENKRRAIFDCIARTESGKQRLGKYMTALEFEKHSTDISERTALALYGKRINMSATNSDTLAKCKFRYLCQYGLRLTPLPSGGFSAPDSGTFVHSVLQHFTEIIVEKGFEFDDEELKSIIDALVEGELNRITRGEKTQTARFLHLFERLKDSIYLVCKNICDELKAGEFVPDRAELAVGDGSGDTVEAVEIRAGDGVTLRLVGRIDRVDKYEKDGQVYIRVVDYKTGPKTFSLSEIYNGLDMQLPLYLFSLWKNGGKLYNNAECVPAAAVYMPATAPTVSADMEAKSHEAEIVKKLNEGMKRSGILLDDVQIVRAMSGELDKTYIAVQVDKEGGLKANKEVTLSTMEQMGKLKKHIEKALSAIGRELLSGKAEIKPLGGEDACKYCDMRAICRYDKKQHGYRRKLKVDDFWEAIADE